jgi:hypothetical protein
VYDAADPNAYGPDGIIRDGTSIRVGLADASPRSSRSSEPLIIKTNMNLRRDFYSDGTPRPRKTQEGRGVDTINDAVASAHRPGFRFADRSASEMAYAELVNDTVNAWRRGPQQHHQHVADSSDACPAGVDPRDWAYSQRCLQDSEAWRTPPPAFDAVPAQAPSGKFPMTAGVGTACDLNGERGTLQPDGSGFLVCRVDRHIGPTRSSAPANRSNDSRTLEMGDEQQAAYREYLDHLENAWRS